MESFHIPRPTYGTYHNKHTINWGNLNVADQNEHMTIIQLSCMSSCFVEYEIIVDGRAYPLYRIHVVSNGHMWIWRSNIEMTSNRLLYI